MPLYLSSHFTFSWAKTATLQKVVNHALSVTSTDSSGPVWSDLAACETTNDGKKYQHGRSITIGGQSGTLRAILAFEKKTGSDEYSVDDVAGYLTFRVTERPSAIKEKDLQGDKSTELVSGGDTEAVDPARSGGESKELDVDVEDFAAPLIYTANSVWVKDVNKTPSLAQSLLGELEEWTQRKKSEGCSRMFVRGNPENAEMNIAPDGWPHRSYLDEVKPDSTVGRHPITVREDRLFSLICPGSGRLWRNVAILNDCGGEKCGDERCVGDCWLRGF